MQQSATILPWSGSHVILYDHQKRLSMPISRSACRHIFT